MQKIIKLPIFIAAIFAFTSIAGSYSKIAKALDRTASRPAVALDHKMPLWFEASRQGMGDQIRFFGRGDGYVVLFAPQEITLLLRDDRTGYRDVRMKLRGANPYTRVTGTQKLSSTSNYLVGNNPENWTKGHPHFAKVKYEDVYPNIDMIFYSNGHNLQFDFIVAPGGEPNSINLGFEGADRLALNNDGGLVLASGGQELIIRAPFSYQMNDGFKRKIDSQFKLKTKFEVGFDVASYEGDQTLVIDPELVYSSFLDSGFGNGIARDSVGNIFVTGLTAFPDFPVTVDAFQPEIADVLFFFGDAFLSKFDPTGTSLLYSTFLGGSSADVATDIVLDGDDNVYLVGETRSLDFPTMDPIQTASPTLGVFPNIWDVFVSKLSADGSTLVFSTYLGGNNVDEQSSIALDEQNNVHVAGLTISTDFPTVNAIQPFYEGGSTDGFITKLNSSGTGIVYSTYLGGIGGDNSRGITTDSEGNAYITGATSSPDFPVTPNAFDDIFDAGEAFITKLSPDGSQLIYSTFLGGSTGDGGSDIAVDDAGNAYVIGVTLSADFPTVNAFQPDFGSSGFSLDAFVSKLNPMGSELVFSSFLGGESTDTGIAIAVGPAGHVFLTGSTGSDDFPIVDAFQPNPGSARSIDAFAAMVCSSGSSLLYSSYLGGGNAEEGFDITVDDGGSVLLTGVTGSRNYPTTDDAFQDMVNFTVGRSNVFFARVGPFDPVAILNDLIDFVLDPVQGFNPGTQNPLIDKLETAIAKIEDGNAANDQAIPSTLSDFEAIVEARRDKQIDGADADYMIEEAERVSCFFGG